MFHSLKAESDRMAFERGAMVQLGLDEMRRIQENENLEDADDDRRLNFIVRDYLERWCHANVRCRWEMNREVADVIGDVLQFSFSSKKEAVRFKLTWGGK